MIYIRMCGVRDSEMKDEGRERNNKTGGNATVYSNDQSEEKRGKKS